MGITHRRTRLAAILAVLWVVGFELMPWLHVALHDHLAPHHHHGDEIDLDHHDDAEDDDDATVHRAPARGAHWLARALQHGAHSIEHHGVAVPAPAPALTHPLPVDRRPVNVATIAQSTPASPVIPHAHARGPPTPT